MTSEEINLPNDEMNLPEEEKRPDAPAKSSDWNTEPMPKKNAVFTLEREFSEEEMAVLRMGNIPKEMEDKWFLYMEDNVLYAHRSWTGICVYIIEFKPDNKHKVTVNRDRQQVDFKSTKEAAENLNQLLNWWSQPHYDYYGEWLDETIRSIQNNKEN